MTAQLHAISRALGLIEWDLSVICFVLGGILGCLLLRRSR